MTSSVERSNSNRASAEKGSTETCEQKIFSCKSAVGTIIIMIQIIIITLVEFHTSDPPPQHAHAQYGGEPNHNKLLFLLLFFSSSSPPPFLSLPLPVLQQLDGALLSLGASHNQIFMQPYGGEWLIEIYCQGDAVPLENRGKCEQSGCCRKVEKT